MQQNDSLINGYSSRMPGGSALCGHSEQARPPKFRTGAPSIAWRQPAPFRLHLERFIFPLKSRLPIALRASPSRRRDYHFDDTPCLSLLVHLLKVQGGAVK